VPAADDPAGLAARLAARDLSLWPTGSAAPSRLGWLESPAEMRARAAGLEEWAAGVRETFDSVVLLGIGGSTLAAEVLSGVMGGPLLILDTVEPATVAATLESAETGGLALAASKSGVTLETTALLAAWRARVPDPGRCAVVTDRGSPLDHLATRAGFAAVFRVRPDIGGRYSVLSDFGLLPAALCGAEVGALLEFDDADLLPGVELGLALAADGSAGRDKVTVVASPRLGALPWWVEQALAEATGKDGVGLVPVVGEPVGPASSYGPDRTFLAASWDAEEIAGLDALEAAGHPVHRLVVDGLPALGELFFRLQVASVAAATVLGVDPFVEPDVEATREACAAALDGDLPPPADSVAPEDVGGLVEGALVPGGYVALGAWLAPSPAVSEALSQAQARLRDRTGVAVTADFGPRYLHSSGQLHKGGPKGGLCVQLHSGGNGGPDVPVPERGFGFAHLLTLESRIDFDVLAGRGRPVLRVDLGEDPVAGLDRIASV
jgi:transaldolase/glucose-6-phosphate isomerase